MSCKTSLLKIKKKSLDNLGDVNIGCFMMLFFKFCICEIGIVLMFSTELIFWSNTLMSEWNMSEFVISSSNDEHMELGEGQCFWDADRFCADNC